MKTKESIMRSKRGITLLALIITIIVLLILAGVAVNALIGENGIIKNTISVVEKSNIETGREKIELSILGIKTSGEKEITLDKIIDNLIGDNITTEENANRENGQVKTEDGYIYEIIEDEKGNWEVEYVGKGEVAKTELTINVTKDKTTITNKLTITITAKAESGIKSYTSPSGETKTYSSGIEEISETYEVTANGTYTFTVENNNGKSETKEIEINNILEGTIAIEASTTEPTNENITVTITWPSGSEQGVKQVKIGEEEWKTYTGESTEIIVEENCEIKAIVKSSTEDITTATITIDNIDKTGPSAPTITGGSTEYATSRTISVSTEATDEGSGIAYYEYYLSGSSTEPTGSTEATGQVGSTASETAKTFDTDCTGYYVYFRAVDNVGNKGEWSNAERLYIDTKAPTVIANPSSVTITEGDSHAVSEYFTASANGDASIISTTYSVTNTSSLAAGTHTVTCTVTKANGLSASASITVEVYSAKVACTACDGTGKIEYWGCGCIADGGDACSCEGCDTTCGIETCSTCNGTGYIIP